MICRYLLTGRLRSVGLHVGGVFPSECLEYLLLGTKWNLEELRLSVAKVRVEFPELLRKLLENSHVLNRLEVLCTADCELEEDLQDMAAIIRRNNWNIDFLYHVQSRTRAGPS